MVKEKKKGERGAATGYITRNVALKRLQIKLKDFRRICILKGIYPHEPRNKKKANKGSSAPRTFYYKKDIQFLSHEPILNKFRDFSVFVRKIRRAVNRKDFEHADKIKDSRPIYKLDNVVKERYPSFIDALRDLDDAISMCFMFSNLPKLKSIHAPFTHLCRRLTMEFMHYVIESRSLRKVFISIKGYYFQADIQGEIITWVIPHQFGFTHPADVDYRVMSTFVEFYTTLLGFVNFRLFHSLNLHYPPKITNMPAVPTDDMNYAETSERLDERVAALNQSLNRIASSQTGMEEEPKIDEFLLSNDPDSLEKLKREEQEVTKQQKLFENMRFFLNREVPREPFTFAIRSVGGEVSWDPKLFVGATYEENDEKITHHLIDRPTVGETQYMNRYYIQPQWVFDCINERKLLPTEDYFVGTVLPAHLSPFVDEKDTDYVPLERLKSKGIALEVEDDFNDMEVDEDDDDEVEEEKDEEKDDEVEEKDEEKDEDAAVKTPKRKLQTTENGNAKKNKKEMSTPISAEPKPAVTPGTVEIVDKEEVARREAAEEKRFALMMLPKRKKHLYDKIMKGQKKRAAEARNLLEKRRSINSAQKKKAKRTKSEA